MPLSLVMTRLPREVMLRSMSDSQQEKVALAEVIGKIKA